MQKLSVFITTFNNEETLSACLESVGFADEVVVLDSFSTDATVTIAERAGAIVHQHQFLGYGRQKQLALDHTTHPWVLFLDADEMLSTEVVDEIRARLANDTLGANDTTGYELKRIEQVFWRMSGDRTRKNYYTRLFHRNAAEFSEMRVHATVVVEGRVERLTHGFYHFGEASIHIKVDKINGYSTGLVLDKVSKGRRPSAWTMVFYPPLFFVRSFIFKRGFTNGWAGFIASVVATFYVFLKYAKLYEHKRFEDKGVENMPAGAPALRSPDERFNNPV